MDRVDSQSSATEPCVEASREGQAMFPSHRNGRCCHGGPHSGWWPPFRMLSLFAGAAPSPLHRIKEAQLRFSATVPATCTVNYVASSIPALIAGVVVTR